MFFAEKKGNKIIHSKFSGAAWVSTGTLDQSKSKFPYLIHYQKVQIISSLSKMIENKKYIYQTKISIILLSRNFKLFFTIHQENTYIIIKN